MCHCRRDPLRLVGLVMCLSVATTGCVHLPTTDMVALPVFSQAVPDEMVVTVSPMPLENEDRQRHQGLFCRVYFFANKEPIPIKTRGKLTAVATDSRLASDDTTSTFAVEASEFRDHERKDLVGECYVFWFPYEPKEDCDLNVHLTFQATGSDRTIHQSVQIHLSPSSTVGS